MADEDLGCCANTQKWLIFIVNIILFIFGTVQVGVAGYILAAGSDSLGFLADVLDDKSNVKAILAFGLIIVFISFLGCCGAKTESKWMLWNYALILFFMIMGQVMTVGVTAISIEYGDSIFESLWKNLDAGKIDDIQQTYKCCSFNGDDEDTWPADAIQYGKCKMENDWEPMQTCWGKFEKTVDESYDMMRMCTVLVLSVQILIYFSTHCVIQSIAEADGKESEKDEIEIHGGAPHV